MTDVDSTDAMFHEPPRDRDAERSQLSALKRLLYDRAPLFVRMRVQLRREVQAELAAKHSTGDGVAP